MTGVARRYHDLILRLGEATGQSDTVLHIHAGMAVLVQLQKLGQPRGVEVVLVAPPVAVARPLQLSGLWLRFPVEEHQAAVDDRVDREGGTG